MGAGSLLRVVVVPEGTERLDTASDLELVGVMVEGNTAAFQVLYDRHVRPAYGLALHMLADSQAAEDVVQEAFLAFWRTASRFDAQRGSVQNYILSMVRNKAIDVLRARRRCDTDPDIELRERPDPDDLVEQQTLRRLDSETLRRALWALPEDQRRALELAYFGGYSRAEIAAVLHVPMGTIKSRLRLALVRLHKQVAGVTEAAS